MIVAKKRVVVLMGGRSSEYDVSISSGKEVVNSLDPEKFDVLPIVITRDGKKWLPVTRERLNLSETTLKNAPQSRELVKLNSRTKEISLQDSRILDQNTVVFIAMHGRFGEDGIIQGMLEAMGLRYTGSGVLASALGMDKLLFRKIMKAENVKIPKYLAVNKDFGIKEIKKSLDYPMFIKPNSQGSSVGAGIARNEMELIEKIKNALTYDSTVLVDEYIKGREFTCAVLGTKNCYALPVVEIKSLKGEFFDYQSKYTESGSEEICPAEISPELTKQIQDLAVRVYKIIGCRGFGRVDFLLKNGKTPMVLEINTIPGLTSASLFPKSAKTAGLSFTKLIDKIINYALE